MGTNCDFHERLQIFLTIIVDYSSYTWTLMIKNKGEASALVQQFCIMVKNQFNKSIKSIRADNGPEFKINNLYSENGITHQKSYVETPQQNGLVEGNINTF